MEDEEKVMDRNGVGGEQKRETSGDGGTGENLKIYNR